MGFFNKDIYGPASLAKALRGIDFPASKYQLIDEVGDKPVRWFKDAEAISVREILEKLEFANFESPNQVIEEVSRQITVV